MLVKMMRCVDSHHSYYPHTSTHIEILIQREYSRFNIYRNSIRRKREKKKKNGRIEIKKNKKKKEKKKKKKKKKEGEEEEDIL